MPSWPTFPNSWATEPVRSPVGGPSITTYRPDQPQPDPGSWPGSRHFGRAMMGTLSKSEKSRNCTKNLILSKSIGNGRGLTPSPSHGRVETYHWKVPGPIVLQRTASGFPSPPSQEIR